MGMQQGPIRRKTIEFEAVAGWQGAPQTLNVLPLASRHGQPRPHANLRAGAVTFPDVGSLSFRVSEEAEWREFLPYSFLGFVGGWVVLGLLSWL
jgi:hypothetical protein